MLRTLLYCLKYHAAGSYMKTPHRDSKCANMYQEILYSAILIQCESNSKMSVSCRNGEEQVRDKAVIIQEVSKGTKICHFI